ncbi:MAG TPA: IDEAL domain-containing protein [Pseudogracilibacillus sp.]|nr:IDEAL domain-containing protein [Pseudogracilibacillus sp.]
MKKQKIVYRFYRYDGKMLRAKSELPFDMQLFARLVLDELCDTWNKKQLRRQIDDALKNGDKEQFYKLSQAYKSFSWE